MLSCGGWRPGILLYNQSMVHRTAPEHSYPAQPSVASRLRNTALPLGPRNCHHSLKVLSSAHFYFPRFSTLWRALFITWFQLRKDVDGSQIYISSLLIVSPGASPRRVLLKLETIKGVGGKNQCFSPFSIQVATLSQHCHCSSWHTVLALVPWL